MTDELRRLAAEARAAAFVIDPGDVGQRLDAAIGEGADPEILGELFLARAIFRQGYDGFNESADDCLEAFRLLRTTDRHGTAALAAAVGAGLLQRAGDLRSGIELAFESMVLTDSTDPDSDSARAANALSVFFGQIAALGLALHYAALSFRTAMSPEVKEIGASTAAWIATEALRSGVPVGPGFAEEVVTWLETRAVSEFGRIFLAPNARVELALATGDMDVIAALRLDPMPHDFPPRLAAIRRALLGNVAFRQGDLAEAKRHLDVAIPDLVTMDNHHRLIRAYRDRSHARAGLGDLEGALADAHAEADFVRSTQIEHLGQLSEQIAARVELEISRRALVERAEELTRAVRIDPVTKVGSRRWLEMALDDLEGRTGTAAVAMFDLDHFKDVNDRFGHAVGDDVLERVGHILLTCASAAELVARYGGEEFTAVFPGQHIEVAVAYAEKVRSRLAVEEWVGFDVPLDLRVSVGVSTGPVAFVRSTLDAADRALYRAKKSGRDRVVTG